MFRPYNRLSLIGVFNSWTFLIVRKGTRGSQYFNMKLLILYAFEKDTAS